MSSAEILLAIVETFPVSSGLTRCTMCLPEKKKQKTKSQNEKKKKRKIGAVSLLKWKHV